MPIENVSFNNITDAAADYIKKNCCNLDSAKYNSVEMCFKSSNNPVASYTYGQYGTDGHKYDLTTKIYVSSNFIPNQTSSISKNDIINSINGYFSSIGKSYTGTATMTKFLSYFDNLMSFCIKNMAFATSPYSSKTYLYYKGDNADIYAYDDPVDSKIYAESANEVIDLLKTKINHQLRCIPVRYKIDFNTR